MDCTCARSGSTASPAAAPSSAFPASRSATRRSSWAFSAATSARLACAAIHRDSNSATSPASPLAPALLSPTSSIARCTSTRLTSATNSSCSFTSCSRAAMPRSFSAMIIRSSFSRALADNSTARIFSSKTSCFIVCSCSFSTSSSSRASSSEEDEDAPSPACGACGAAASVGLGHSFGANSFFFRLKEPRTCSDSAGSAASAAAASSSTRRAISSSSSRAAAASFASKTPMSFFCKSSEPVEDAWHASPLLRLPPAPLLRAPPPLTGRAIKKPSLPLPCPAFAPPAALYRTRRSISSVCHNWKSQNPKRPAASALGFTPSKILARSHSAKVRRPVTATRVNQARLPSTHARTQHGTTRAHAQAS
mmetsp:Transcript_9905/g.25449  ORF Transcript_9905/g.25449 Transcript_9905/m.25449 type:complete len:365 (-) Transcript_9905:39-1133(-)